MSSHSPTELHIYDQAGNHTGPTPEGDIEYGIPDVEYDVIEHAKFVFLPEDGIFTVINRATDTGLFNFIIENIQNSETVETISYYNIPLNTTSTNTEIIIEPDQISFELSIDQDGDDNFETSTEPTAILNEQEFSDIISPNTSITVSGNKKRDYFIQALIELSAADDNSGIYKTYYSVDGGQTWQTYTEPFNLTKSGEIVFKYFSTDKAGNPESIKKELVLNISLEPIPLPDDEPAIILPSL